jgi:hypothetical protein
MMGIRNAVYLTAYNTVAIKFSLLRILHQQYAGHPESNDTITITVLNAFSNKKSKKNS